MTSIEWLQSKMKIYGLSTAKKLEIVTLFEEAKAMHKAEILAAFTEGASDGYYGESDSNRERYYSETFKK